MLRMGIVLKEQIIDKTSYVNEGWLTKNYSEKKIFGKAEKLGLISKDFSDDLHSLYDGRNAVVHRFVITEVAYEYSKRLASEFEPRIVKLNEVLSKIEEEQIEKRIGMTVSGENVLSEEKERMMKELDEFFMKKMGNDLEKINKVRSHKWSDVEDIIEFVSKKGYTKKCKNCKHIKALHIDNDTEAPQLLIAGCTTKGCGCKQFR